MEGNGILVIEDYYQMRRYFEVILSLRKHPVSSTSNLTEGIKLIQEQLPKLVILNLKLPDSQEPLETLQKLLSVHTGKILIVTGIDDPVLAIRLRSFHQVADVIEKGQSFSTDRFLEMVDAIMGPETSESKIASLNHQVQSILNLIDMRNTSTLNDLVDRLGCILGETNGKSQTENT